MQFRWIEWNITKVEGHGVRPEEAEYVVEHAKRPIQWKAPMTSGWCEARQSTDVRFRSSIFTMLTTRIRPLSFMQVRYRIGKNGN